MKTNYLKMVTEAFNSISENNLNSAYNLINDFAVKHKQIYVFGNGGSAAIAEHLSCDMSKGLHSDCMDWPGVISLVSNQALITAIANDHGYEWIFADQLHLVRNPGLSIAISSSGNSKNIVLGLQCARARGNETMAFVGFDGGTVLRENLADCIIHVKSNNYGVIEDCHQMVMHMLSQEIRKNNHGYWANLKL